MRLAQTARPAVLVAALVAAAGGCAAGPPEAGPPVASAPTRAPGVFFDVEVRASRDRAEDLIALAAPVLELLDAATRLPGAGADGSPVRAAVERALRALDLESEPRQLEARLEFLDKPGSEGLRYRIARRGADGEPPALELLLLDALHEGSASGAVDRIRFTWPPESLEVRFEREAGAWVQRVRLGEAVDYRLIAAPVSELAAEIDRRLYQPHIGEAFRRLVRDARVPPGPRGGAPAGTAFPLSGEGVAAGSEQGL